MSETIKSVNIQDLLPFKDHPFKLRDGEEREELMTSIKVNKIIEPLIVRHILTDGKYEVISGHRRLDALKRLGINEVPVIIKNLSDEEAIIMMVDSNLKRENILPSEKAYAYKMKLDVFRKQNKDELTLSQLGTQRNDSFVAKQLASARKPCIAISA